VYFNRLLDLELAEVAYKIAVKEQFGSRRARQMRSDGRALRRASRLAGKLSSSWDAVLDNFTWARAEVQDVTDEVPALMRRGLASYDAVHAATALRLGVGYLVTIDSGFGMVRQSDLTIVTEQTLLGACRRHRKRSI
jgi:predicted nucleic acid-binding protein